MLPCNLFYYYKLRFETEKDYQMNNIGDGQIPTIQYLVELNIAYLFLSLYNTYEL